MLEEGSEGGEVGMEQGAEPGSKRWGGGCVSRLGWMYIS